MELLETDTNGFSNDKETLFMLAGLSLMVFGAGLVLTNPVIRRYMSQFGVGNLTHGTLPDVERYLKLRAM